MIGDDPLSAEDHIAMACEKLYRQNALIWIALRNFFELLHVFLILGFICFGAFRLCQKCALFERVVVEILHIVLVGQLQQG
jgi:hypothetical protein